MTAHSTLATTYVFDPILSSTAGTDGTGTWDTVTSNWFNTSGGSNPQVWSNSTADTAQFGVGGTAGTVTVGAVSVGTVIFNTVSGSYLLTGGTMNLGGSAVVFADSGVTPTIASTVTAAGFNKTGLGTLTLTGADTFANQANVLTGTLILSGNVTDTFNNQIAVGANTGAAGSPAGTSSAPNTATLNISSGTTVNAGGQNVGLGNGDNSGSTTAYQSLFLNVSGTLTTTNQLFSEYATAVNTTANIAVNNGGVVNVGTIQLGLTSGTSSIFTNNGNVTSGSTFYTGGNSNTSTAVATIVNNGNLTLTSNNFRFGGLTTFTNTGTTTVPNNLYFYGPTTVNNSGTLTANVLQFGFGGATAGGTFGTLNISGGTFTLAGRSDLNSDTQNAGTVAAGTVNLNISGGTFTDPAYPYLTTLAGQTTTVTQTGGAFNNPSTSTTDGIFFNSGLATYNLAGGVLRTNNVGTSGAPTSGSTFIFNGGTLQGQINSTLGGGFFSPPAAAIGSGGGTIDTQGFNLSAVTPLATAVTGGHDGGFTKLGSGTLSMKGSNTYTGPTTIGGGTLALTGSGSINGSSVITLNTTGAKLLQLSSTASTPPVTLTNGTLDGTGTVGAVTVGNGTGGILANGNGSSGTLTMASLSFLGAATSNVFLSSANLASTNTAPFSVLGTLSSTSAGKVTLNFTSVLSPGSTYDLFKYNAFSGDLSGTQPTDYIIGSGLSGRVAASSSLVLSNTSGAGYLELVVGSADNNIRWSGATDNTWTTSQASPTNWVYSNTSSGTQTPFFNGDFVTFDDTGANTNPINISAGNVSPGSMTFNNSSTTYSIGSNGGYGIAGAGSLVKNGTGVLVMSASNTYTGGTTINAGTLDIGNAAGLGSGGVLTIGNGSSGIITVDNTSGAGITLTDSSLLINNDLTFVGSSNMSTGSGLVTLSGNRTITVLGSVLSIPAVISESGSLTKAGAGTLNLGANNTFNNGTGVIVNAGTVNLLVGGSAGTLSGPLTINGGTVNAAVVDALGFTTGTSTTPVTVNTGATLNLQVGGNNGYVTNLILNGGSVTAVNAAANNSGGIFNFSPGYGITTVASATQSNISSGIDLRNNGANVNTFVVNVPKGTTSTGVDLLISGTVIGDAGATFNKLGAGSLLLSGTNTYPGGTVIENGTLMAGTSSALGTGPVQLGDATSVSSNQNASLQLNNAFSLPNGITVGTSGSTAGVFTISGYNAGGATIAGSVTLNQNLTVSQVAGGTTYVSGAISGGAQGVTVAGGGAIAFSGGNNYSGGTTVIGSTAIALTPSALSTGTVNLSGSTLSLAQPVVAGSSLTTANLTALNRNDTAGNAPTNTGGTITLTDNNGGEARSVLSASPVNLSDAGGFTASFVYTPSGNKQADGVTFVIENDPRGSAAVGGTGGYLGYGASATGQPVINSGAIELNIYTNAGGGVGTAFGTNGAISTNNSVAPVQLAFGNPVEVDLTYSGGTLTETLTDTINGFSDVVTYPSVGFQGLLGGTSGYVGFTGGTGGLTATQTITNFSFASNASPSIQTYANNVAVTSNSTINVTGTLNAAMANLSIGSVLNVASSDTSGSAYSLGFGQTTLTGNATFNVSNSTGGGAGNLTLGSISSTGGNSVTVTGNGTAIGNGTVMMTGSNNYTGGTFVNAGGKLVLASANAFPSGTPLNVSSGSWVQVATSSNNSSYIPTLSQLSNSGVIDLTNNAMVIQNAGSSIGTLFNEIKAGYNNGSWNGSGSSVILSSTAAADITHLTALGIATGLTSFGADGGSISVSANDVVLKYTYYGDANLDGQVDGSDYTKIDNGFINHLTGWQNGDFNYDGVVDGSDYTLIDNAFNTQGAQIDAQFASPEAQISGAGTSSAVPEPASLGLIGMGALGLLGRRSRRHR